MRQKGESIYFNAYILQRKGEVILAGKESKPLSFKSKSNQLLIEEYNKLIKASGMDGLPTCEVCGCRHKANGDCLI